MTPEQIKRAKRLAEILGLNICESVMQLGDNFIPTGRGLVYADNFVQFRPEQDKALLWDLMFEHKLIIRSDATDKEEAAAKLIDRVIEINGGYNEQS